MTKLRRRLKMGRYVALTPEERARITDIQDLLISRYVEQKHEIERGNRFRVNEIDVEIRKPHLIKGEDRGMGGPLTRRHVLGSVVLAGVLGAALLGYPTAAYSQVDGALQYPPSAIGADARPPPPAGMVPLAASPRWYRPGVSGSGEWLPGSPPFRRVQAISGEC